MTDSVAFTDLDLAPLLQEAIAGVGYTHLTPVQSLMLPPAIAGQDVIVKAQTGSGKTAAFLVTMAQQLLTEGRIAKGRRKTAKGTAPEALVICPVRELAKQITSEANDLARVHNLNAVAIYGGTQTDEQIQELHQKEPALVVGTPGRLLDLYRRRELSLDSLRYLVIDEADRMMDLGFIADVSNLVFNTPKERKTYFLSATFPKAIRDMAQRWTRGAQEISVEGEGDSIPDSVTQKVYTLRSHQRIRVIRNIFAEVQAEQSEKSLKAIVFVNRRDAVDRVYEALTQSGFRVARMSGAMRQNMRERTLERFHDGKLDIVVATDVAGRGIHVNDITHVVNFDLPETPDAYVHRVGRTGRMGKSGTSISFATEDDAYVLLDVEEQLGERLDIQEIPQHYLADIKTPLKKTNRNRRRHTRSRQTNSTGEKGDS